jgi:hypothetical protein
MKKVKAGKEQQQQQQQQQQQRQQQKVQSRMRRLFNSCSFCPIKSAFA